MHEVRLARLCVFVIWAIASVPWSRIANVTKSVRPSSEVRKCALPQHAHSYPGKEIRKLRLSLGHACLDISEERERSDRAKPLDIEQANTPASHGGCHR